MRRYAHGGIRTSVTLTLRAQAVCCLDSEREALIEELYDRADRLCSALPAVIGEEDVLCGEMIARPSIIERQGNTVSAECRLSMVLRRSGSMRGTVPFFGDSGGIYAPVGLFDLQWEEKGTAASRYLDEPTEWRYLTGGGELLRFSFDRMLGQAGQELLLKLADRQARGQDAVIAVYRTDTDCKDERGYRCVRIPMTVQLNGLRLEEGCSVFSGCLFECGRRKAGFLRQDADQNWQFNEENGADDAWESREEDQI